MQVENENNPLPDCEILSRWLNSIPFGDYFIVKRKLIAECLVSASTFNNWLYGRCRIPLASKRDINRFTKETTGEELFTIVRPGGSTEGEAV